MSIDVKSLALDYASRCGWEHNAGGGFRVAHPDDIAKAMLALLKEVEAAKTSADQPVETTRSAFEKWAHDNGKNDEWVTVGDKDIAFEAWNAALATMRESGNSASEVCHQLREAIMHLTHEKVFTKDSSVIQEMEAAINEYNGWNK